MWLTLFVFTYISDSLFTLTQIYQFGYFIDNRLHTFCLSMPVVHMSLSSIISVYWASWNSSECVIPQRRYDLWLLLLPVRIVTFQNRAWTPVRLLPFSCGQEEGWKQHTLFFFSLHLSILSLICLFSLLESTRLMLLACVIALLKESFCVRCFQKL